MDVCVQDPTWPVSRNVCSSVVDHEGVGVSVRLASTVNHIGDNLSGIFHRLSVKRVVK